MQKKNKDFFHVAPITAEEAENQLKAFTSTDKGFRIEKSVESSVEFTQKHDKKPLMVMQMKYFALIAYSRGIYEALTMMYFYAYRKGYNSAKKEKRNKQ